MSSEKILFTNILGVGKNGTTLMGSLLDNHPEISTFPMEMKFVEHYFNTVKDKSFEGIINFFLKKSKINQLNLQNKLSDKEEEIKRVVTGNLTSIYFDKSKFEKIITQNTTEKIKNDKDFKKILIFLHVCLNKYLSKPFKNKIVIQDGCFGLRYIEQQFNILGNIKFIVIIRNPLDVYVSFKKITKQFKFFRRFIGDFSREERMTTSRNYLNYTMINRIFEKYKNDDKFLFVKYENLVLNPEKEMREIANFLNIEFSNDLVNPSVFGQSWLGNSSRSKEKKNIDSKEVNKFKEFLNNDEINFLEFKHQKFFKNFEYQNHIKKISKSKFFYCLLKIYLKNIKEAKNIISSKNFILKYFYYIIFLNNSFLIRNLIFVFSSE